MKTKMNLKTMLCLILTIFMCVAFLSYASFNNGSILTFVVFICTFYFSCKRFNKINHEEYIAIIFLSFALGFLYTLGYDINLNSDNYSYNLIDTFTSLLSYIRIFGVSYFYYLVITALFDACKKIEINSNDEVSSKKLFKFSFLALFIVYGIFYLIFFPGICTNDTFSQMDIILGRVHFNDHHSFFITMVMYIPFSIGKLIFSSNNAGVAFITFFQMITIISILSYFLTYLASLNISKKYLKLVLCFYMFFPIFAFYSVTVWKDVIFGYLFLLLTIGVHKLVNNGFNKKNNIYFIIVSFLFLMTRNNAIYVYLFFIPFMIITFKKQLKNVLLCVLIILFSYAFVKYPLYSMIGVKKTSSAEYIGMPLQQIGRMSAKGIKFTDYELNTINKLIPASSMAVNYLPYISDGIKFHNHFKIDVFNENKKEYFILWFNLVRKNPGSAIEAYLNSTIGYWYPDYKYWSTWYKVDDNNIDVTNLTTSEFTRRRLVNLVSREIPIIGYIYSIGLMLYIVLLSFVLTVRKEKSKLIYVLPLGLWLSLMVAAPVAGEYRYIFGIICTMPFYMLYPFMKNNKIE